MIVQCPICTEIFTETTTAVAFHCGHIFHDFCLLKWLENSSTCPQCRAKVKRNSFFKLYFSVSSSSCSQIISNDGSNTDSDVDRVGRLEDQFLIANNTIKQKSVEHALLAAEKNRVEDRLKNITEELSNTKEILKQEEIRSKLLKYELKNSQKIEKELEKAKMENVELIRQIETLGNVQLVINGSEEDIEKMIKDCIDTEQLAIWCCVYKRELDRKKTDLRLALETTRRLKKEAEVSRKQLAETSCQLKHLEDKDLRSKEVIVELEDQVKSLNKKISALQAAINSPRHTTTSLVHRLLHESPVPLNISLPQNFNTPVSVRRRPQAESKLDYDQSDDAREEGKTNQNEDRQIDGVEPVSSKSSIEFKAPSRKRKVSSNVENESEGDKRRKHLHSSQPSNGISSYKEVQATEYPSKEPTKSFTATTAPEDSSNQLLNLNIFRKHRSVSGLKTSSFLSKTSSSSLPSSDPSTMVCRKGYDGFGGHEKFIAPTTSRLRASAAANQSIKNLMQSKGSLQSGSSLARKNLGPSTSSSSNPAKKKGPLPSLLDDFF